METGCDSRWSHEAVSKRRKQQQRRRQSSAGAVHTVLRQRGTSELAVVDGCLRRTQDCVGEPAPSQQQGTPQHSATCCHHILWCQSYAHSLPSSFHKNVEAQFLLHRITSQATKYLHVVSSLPAEVADELEDILAAAPTSNQYDNLKAAILARKTTSERSCLQHLLNMKELGNQRPSRLLRRMRQLLGDATSNAETSLLRELFLQRLPHNMVVVLAASEDMPLERLADLADRVAEYSTPPVVAAASFQSRASDPAAAAPSQDIAARLSRLEKTIQDLQLPAFSGLRGDSYKKCRHPTRVGRAVRCSPPYIRVNL
ncbi:uncharacterized protein LOC120847150 isoform X2 [Ixodes scapularis]|uniref:uncharacterized protein LOC120847150 isoform X2 n=1 Tax=Ixodes scapularis TaxID=6945 RepID=UPI001C38B3DD|nr:uncharacterized protein LOC120847150 isoform X2 [Ixodes scapularis]XP_042143670.1 uncharacterized protein LOC120847150 isoform X2 [Ixodes scapularis]